jgi:hypothetical protein
MPDYDRQTIQNYRRSMEELADKQEDLCFKFANNDNDKAAKARRLADLGTAHINYMDRLVTIADVLDAQGITWHLQDQTTQNNYRSSIPKLSIIAKSPYEDGGDYRFSQYTAPEQQLAQFFDPEGYAQYRRESKTWANLHKGCNLKWLLENLNGVNATKAKDALLKDTGYVKSGILTPRGGATGFFIQRHKREGHISMSWVDLTPKGIRWVVQQYENGFVPRCTSEIGYNGDLAHLIETLQKKDAIAAEARNNPINVNDYDAHAETLPQLQQRAQLLDAEANRLEVLVENWLDPDGSITDLRKQMRDARDQATDLTRLVALAEAVTAKGMRFTTDGRFTLEAVSDTDPTPIRLTVFRDINEQIGVLNSDNAEDYQRTTERNVLIGETKNFRWVFGQLEGVKPNNARTQVLFESGYATEEYGDLALTEAGKASGFFVTRSGDYGTFMLMTAKGMDWVTSLYERGELPLKKANQPMSIGEDLSKIVLAYREYEAENTNQRKFG